MNLIGSRVKYIRKMLEKSQEQLAKEMQITKQAVSNIENSKSLPSINFLSKLLIDYGININYILSGQGEVFIKNEKTYSSLRQSLIKEVELMLQSRGIN